MTIYQRKRQKSTGIKQTPTSLESPSKPTGEFHASDEKLRQLSNRLTRVETTVMNTNKAIAELTKVVRGKTIPKPIDANEVKREFRKSICSSPDLEAHIK